MNEAGRLLAIRAIVRGRMLASLLPEQRRAIEDPRRLKALFCPRRSGKSWCIGVYCFLVAYSHPSSSVLYLGLTRSSALGIMVKDIFRKINHEFQLGAVWVESKGRWELPNGSHIVLRGADANAYEIEKVVGQKYRLAIFDEASKYRHDIDKMVFGALLPAMGDDLGTIVLAGTPSNINTGLFFRVTTGLEPSWGVHHWTWRNNTFRAENIQQLHDDYIASKPGVELTPLYRQEWLGEWVVDSSALVYKARQDWNTIDRLPAMIPGPDGLPRSVGAYTYMLGVDTGFKPDPTAFVLGAFAEHDPTLYLVDALKQHEIIFSTCASIVRGYMRQYPNLQDIIVDAPLQGTEEMRQAGQIPFKAAEKTGKKLAIDRMNSDLMTQRIKVLPGAMAIFDEWEKLVWDDKQLRNVPPVYKENGTCENHLCDAALYMWRASKHYLASDAPPPVAALRTQSWIEQELERREDEPKQFHDPYGRGYDPFGPNARSPR